MNSPHSEELSEAIATIEGFNPWVIDKLTIEKIEQLRKEAYEKGMNIDWERAELVPYAADHPREKQFTRDDEGDMSSSRIEQQGWE